MDGSLVPVVLSNKKAQRYIGRKGFPTQNVMAICNFDMLFTFVSAGMPGSAHDTRVLTEVTQREQTFPHPPSEKYYLVDSGYPCRTGYLSPYKGQRYHMGDFRQSGAPRNTKELFNYAHSSLHSVIERSFGVWKMKWMILKNMPRYPLNKQIAIVAATMTLHNFIKLHKSTDRDFDQCDENDDYLVHGDDELRGRYLAEEDEYMKNFRDQLASQLAEDGYN